ncbi:MAG: extracellular solute-binding protein [Oscillospiraceae bacterium]|nr:extracellular solute-binding protein [Oscillospiraceae bacterium]
MKKILALILAAVMLTGAFAVSASAVNEDVEGTVGIYSSMYQFVIDMMDEAIKKEFPNLTPAYDGSFFFYGGTSSLITKIYGEMETGVLGCDMMLVAEPAFSLELKEAGYLEPIEVEGADTLLRFPYDEEGYWYPVRVCNMVLAYNPEMVDDWAAKGVTIPKTFQDFANDPSLKGYISMGNPLTSGTTFAAVASLTQDNHYGEAYLDGLAANEVMIESGSTAITKLQTGECAAIMILEESILKVLKEAEDAGTPITNLEVIYPEDGVVLIPSTVMTVAEDHSANVNTEACEALEQWLLSEEAQKLILQGYMHSVFAGMEEIPYGSVDTDGLIAKDLGVDWENAYRNREEINTLWTEKVTTK